ncbi:MAG TPA: amidohydrolase [Methylocystis sp.]|nr:amidohydrolase [Methylocystis sp.]
MCLICGNANFGRMWGRLSSKQEQVGAPIEMTRRRLVATGIAAGALAAAPPPSFAAPEKITIFRNGRIYTVEDAQPWAQAVVVGGRRILYVGNDAGAMKFAGPGAEVFDLNGRMMLPGFVEAHWHLASVAFARGAWVNYDRTEEIYEALRQYAKAHPDEKIITGFGWMAAKFPETGPRKEPLDEIVPDRPVLLISNDFHNYWVNSKFLEMAGIDKNTPRDVVPGASWFEKDAKTGEPTGFMSEPPALFATLEAFEKRGIEPYGLRAAAAAMEEWQPRLAGAGITTFFDAGFVLWPDQQHNGFDILVDLERRGKLLQRVVGSFYYNDAKVDPLPIIREYKRKYQTALVQANVLKLVADGTEYTRTAFYLQSYAGKPDWRGEPLLPPDVMNRVARAADAEGIDMHVHAVGDAAVRMTLDAFEEAMKSNGPRDRRHTLCHAFLTAPEDIPRFHKLGVVANTQIQWGVPDVSQLRIRDILGEERWSRMYSFKSFVDAGATVSFGNDALATGYKVVYKPLEAIQAGHTRQEPGKPDGPLQPPSSERLSIAELIRGYTLNGAYQLRKEKEIGSIKTGKLADLVVLEQNLFDVPPHDIGKARVQLTMMDGRITHRDGLSPTTMKAKRASAQSPSRKRR